MVCCKSVALCGEDNVINVKQQVYHICAAPEDEYCIPLLVATADVEAVPVAPA
jgi:hypothetical protein